MYSVHGIVLSFAVFSAKLNNNVDQPKTILKIEIFNLKLNKDTLTLWIILFLSKTIFDEENRFL